MGGDEVLQRIQPLAEVGLNRHRDDAPLRVGHQTTHAGQLGDGTKTALARARQRHDRQRAVGVHGLLYRVGDVVFGIVPLLNRPLVLLLFGQQAAAELAVDLIDAFAGGFQDRLALLRDGQVGHGHRCARYRGEAEADVLDGIDHLDGRRVAENLVDTVNERVDATLVQQAVDEASLLRHGQVEQHATGRRLDDAGDRPAVDVANVAVVVPIGRR